jgi:hypothetical protein
LYADADADARVVEDRRPVRRLPDGILQRGVGTGCSSPAAGDLAAGDLAADGGR